MFSTRRFASFSAVCAVCAACVPSGDLDATARGSGGNSAGPGGSSDMPASGGSPGAGAVNSVSPPSPGGSGTSGRRTSSEAGEGSASGGTPATAAGAGMAAGLGEASSASGGVSPVVAGGTAHGGESAKGPGGSGAGEMTSGGTTIGGSSGGDNALPELPIDVPDAPIEGEITFSAEASWDIGGVSEPTFEIHTPSGSYWLVKSLGTIVSLVDAGPSQARQWLDFSSFRPLRGVPSFGSFGAAPRFSTELETESRTSRHLRLTSATASGDWQLTWDFYPTHVTLTVRKAPLPYGFGYRGVPGGALDDADTFLSSDGTSRSARDSVIADLGGSTEWVSLGDGALNRSLFLIQHGGDALPDRYQLKDGDSALLLFGDAKLMQVPLRFSLGLLDSNEPASIRSRIEYVVGVVQ